MTEERIFVVDRIENQRAVMIADDDESEVVIPTRMLPSKVTEGMVFRVQVKNDIPDWSTARADLAEQERRLSDARAKLDQLRKRDPGGDLEL